MSQPEWKLVGRIGDCNPINYGGGYIFVDKTGRYCPEAEWIYPVNTDKDESPVDVYRYLLEDCTYVDGVLSDNKYHPEHHAWFEESVGAMAESFGEEKEWMIEKFCSDDPMERAFAWEEVGQYWGWENLDGYPLRLTYAEAEKRYSEEKYNTKGE
jgi:hypothetical protein